MEQLKNNLFNHLQEIVRDRDPYLAKGGHFYVKEYIRGELEQFGSVKEHIFKVSRQNYVNLILDICVDQTKKSKPPIVIGAHYDTVPGSPGADDNGTGIAVLLELARFFSQNNANYPLRLIAFDLEEYGCLGSIAYAKMLKQQNQPIRLMVSLEMLGYCDHSPNSQLYPPLLKYLYPSRGDFITLVGNIFTLGEMMKISRVIRANNTPCEWLAAGVKGKIVPDTRRSDHASFWDAGYKAIMVTDTANLRNPHYHKPSDTIETIDLDFLTNVCQGLIEAIKRL